MDIGSAVNYIQAVLWIVSGSIYAGRLARGERKLHPLVRRVIESNGLLGVLIVVGLLSSVTTSIMLHSVRRTILDANTPIQEVIGKYFSNEIVDLDGKSYSKCNFFNVKLRYQGRTEVHLNDNDFHGSVRLTSDNLAVENAWMLAKGMGLIASPILGGDGNPLPNVDGPRARE